ncbi:hypothetical protein BLX41_07545 [Pseudomonas protegens]|uniref:hypothetical protein n=1 Tax=Pseudomonas protegens TaxID=380021 RepID=UPI000F4B2FB7|nr:hypothetical protein [Pseudomonas protegens]ROL80573.1 hypothetical protein BLX41_07545 [Pseudomonas protegens]
MDNQNPFQAPTAELLANKPADQNLSLYSIAAIGLSTFIGTSVAGAYFINQNLKALGRESEVNKVWAMGIGFFIAMSLAGFFLPESIPAVVFILPPIYGMNAYARQLFGPQVVEHKAGNGRFVSLWRVAGISLLFCLAMAAVVFTLVLLIGFE